MITAIEAAEIANKAHLDINSNILFKIENAIKETIKKGERKLYYYDTIPDLIKKHLESLGYKVRYRQSGINEYCNVITF